MYLERVEDWKVFYLVLSFERQFWWQFNGHCCSERCPVHLLEVTWFFYFCFRHYLNLLKTIWKYSGMVFCYTTSTPPTVIGKVKRWYNSHRFLKAFLNKLWKWKKNNGERDDLARKKFLDVYSYWNLVYPCLSGLAYFRLLLHVNKVASPNQNSGSLFNSPKTGFSNLEGHFNFQTTYIYKYIW